VDWVSRYWWVLSFCLVAAIGFAHAMKSRHAVLADLKFRLSEMEQEYAGLCQLKEDLSLQIASENDPAWVELVLLRQMGVVPEGFLKVHFKQ
jgi:hypothetical protein